MKKLFTLMALALIVSAVSAQETGRQLTPLKVTASETALEQKTVRADIVDPALQPAVSKMPTVITSSNGVTPSQLVRAANATTLFSSDFSNAALWSITNDNSSNRNWVIGTAGPSGSYAIPKILSTTASNGFALLDSDVLNAACKANLTNATAINCTGEPVVYLAFETYLRKYQDKFYVKVSDNGTTWTTTEIFASLPVNGASENPDLVVMDISSVAANKATVYVRFYYESAAGGDYAWMIDDVQVAAGVIHPRTVLKTANFGGVWSAVNDTVYTNDVKYWGLATNSISHSWDFDANATNITPLTSYLPDYDVTSVTYTTSGAHTATFNAVGVDGNNYSKALTRKVVLPFLNMEDYVWNIAPEDSYTYSQFSNNNYVFGVNSYYKRLAERFELPEGVTALVDELAYYFGYYRTTSPATKACVIKIYEEDPVTKLPGTLKGTVNSNFGAAFGTTNVTNGTPTPKSITFNPIEVTGPFYVEFDLTGLGNAGSSNYFSFTATADRLFPQATIYTYYNGAWGALNDMLTGGSRTSLFIMPYITVTYVPTPALAISSRTPAANATDVAIDAEVSVTFNQPITATGTLSDITINGTAATATVSDDKLTINHSNFDYNTVYTVSIPANTITGYADAIIWSFTTVEELSIPVVNGNTINIFQNNGINVLVSEKSDIRVLDIYGRVLGNYNIEANATLKVSQPAGMYLIEVRSGGAVSTHKVIVK